MSRQPKNPAARRFWTAFLLIAFGGVALAAGGWAWWTERDLRNRALTGEAEVVGYLRQVSQRGGEYVGEPNALDLRYRDAAGALRPATMLRAGNEDLAIGSRFPVLYDPADPARVRRADRAADTGFFLALGGGGGAMILVGLALIPGLRRAAAPRPDIGPLPQGGAPVRFYSLAGRPVMETRTADGGADLFALDAATGAFLPARELWPRLRDGAADLDEIDEGLFRQIGRELRRRAMDARTAQEVHWAATGDAEYPWRALLDGHETRIRINDFPDEPLMSLIVAGQSVGELEEWPASWTKPVG